MTLHGLLSPSCNLAVTLAFVPSSSILPPPSPSPLGPPSHERWPVLNSPDSAPLPVTRARPIAPSSPNCSRRVPSLCLRCNLAFWALPAQTRLRALQPSVLCEPSLSLSHARLHQRWTLVHNSYHFRPCPLSLASAAALLCSAVNSHHHHHHHHLHVQPPYSSTADLCTDRPSSTQSIASLHLLFGQLSLALLAPRYSNHSSPTIVDGFLSLTLSCSRNWPLAVRVYCYPQGPLLYRHTSSL